MLAAVLLVLALLVRLAFVAATPDYVPQWDDRHYDGQACALIETGAYPLHLPERRTATSCGDPVRADNPPTAFRPPGYPVLLAGVYAVSRPVTDRRWTAGRAAQAVVGTAAVALIGLLAWQLLGAAAGLAALGLAALDGTLVVIGGSLLSEPLFVCCEVGALCASLAARSDRKFWRWAAAAGVLVGLAALVRSNGLLLVLPLGVLLAPRGWRPVAVLVAAMLLVLAPWTVRNAVRMHAFVPVASYTGSGLAGTFNEFSRTRRDHPGAWRSPSVLPEFRDVHRSGLDELERQAELRRRGLRHAARHPGYALEAAGRNALRVLALAGPSWWRPNATFMSLPRWSGDVAAVSFLVLLAIAVAGLLGRPARSIPTAIWAIPVLLLLSAVFFGGEARYRAPLVPFAVLLAAPVVARAPSRSRRMRPKR